MVKKKIDQAYIIFFKKEIKEAINKFDKARLNERLNGARVIEESFLDVNFDESFNLSM